MQNFPHFPPRRTWDGLRWLYALLTLLFLAIIAWLVFHEGMWQHEARLLLLIPAAFSFACGLCALCVPDKQLQTITDWLTLGQFLT